MARIQTKTYETSYAQRAQVGRIVVQPGKSLEEAEHHRYEVVRDYHIPVGNPNIEAMLRESSYQGDNYMIGNPVCNLPIFPDPVILKTEVITIEGVHAQGTHTLITTEDNDVIKNAKSTGGQLFDLPEEIVAI